MSTPSPRPRTAFHSAALGACVSLVLGACGGGYGGDRPRTLPTNGSATVMTADDEIAVSVQRQDHQISIFQVVPTGATASLARVAEIDTGAGSEPWAAVIGNDGDTAYVILRHAQRVIEVRNLHSSPVIGAGADTGSEPTGLAIAPSGHYLYVANWNEGTITRVRTDDMTVVGEIDLNRALADSGLLGAGLRSRHGLAHPRGLVITNNGDLDDSDESVWVTEFFSQQRPHGDVPMDGDIPNYDLARQGVMYRIRLTDDAVTLHTVSPITIPGYLSTDGHEIGCFPNQLQAPAIHNGVVYVPSVCASPRGPIGPDATSTVGNNFKSLVHSVIFALDANTGMERPDARVDLTSEMETLHQQIGNADDWYPPNPEFICDGARKRMPLLVSDLAFVPGRDEFYAAATGSNAVFRVVLTPNGSYDHVGTDIGGSLGYIELVPARNREGRLPIGIAVGTAHPEMGLVTNDATQNVSVLDFRAQATVDAVNAVSHVLTDAEQRDRDGHTFFVTGVGRWGYHAQGWSSCEGCHPDGLSDGVTWFFKRGPRQSPSLAATYGNDGTRRMFSWTASFDEVQDLESITRGLQGGVGSFVWQMPGGRPALPGDRIDFEATANGGNPDAGPDGHATATPQDFLNGSSAVVSRASDPAIEGSVANFYELIHEYVQNLRAPRAPHLAQSLVDEGRDAFTQQGCAGCHGSARWTVSRVFYQPGADSTDVITGALRTATYNLAGYPAWLNPPAAMGVATFRWPDRASSNGADQMNCTLRDVGTYPAGISAQNTAGVTPDPDVLVNELRHTMAVTAGSGPAQGAMGFNPPSLIGVGATAPFFHAGNARTLEELLHSPAFLRHADAFHQAPSPISDHQVDALVAFLLSIDRDTAPVDLAVPASLGASFDPDLCRQWSTR